MVREDMAVEVLTAQGWYRGYITVPAGGRLLDFLNTKPPIIALTHAMGPSGVRRPFMALNTEQVMAIRHKEQEE
jgi:hypothetical protein